MRSVAPHPTTLRTPQEQTDRSEVKALKDLCLLREGEG
jgi:hypothetical protein